MGEPFEEALRLQNELEELRLNFIRTDLGVCFTLATVVETEHGMGNHEHARQTLAKAERGYSTMLRLLLEAKGPPGETGDELRSKLVQLRKRLDGLNRLVGNAGDGSEPPS